LGQIEFEETPFLVPVNDVVPDRLHVHCQEIASHLVNQVLQEIFEEVGWRVLGGKPDYEMVPVLGETVTVLLVVRRLVVVY